MYAPHGIILAALISLAAAKKCINATVPVTLSARTAIFGNVPVPQTNADVTDFIANLAKQGQNYTQIGLTGYNTTSGIYQISTQFCTPDDDTSTEPTVQILTHGIGFDKG